MKFVDLFSGIGGFRIGLESQGNECIFSSDFDKYACETYEKNFGDYPYSDITLLNEEKIPDHDILSAGFPCQPFSIAGYRKGFDDVRGTLFFDIYRILREKKPKVFILENVKGLINHDKGNTFKTMLNYLAKSVNGEKNIDAFKENLGYTVFWSVLNASNFGVPQNRERVFIIGFRDKNTKFQFPVYTGKKKTLVDILDSRPERKELSTLSKGYIKKYLREHEKFKQIKDLDYLIAYEIRKSRTNFRFDNLSPCLTTKMGTGGNNVPYLVNQDRFLTLKECLKIQGFPENFKLTNSYSHALRQIGNSVAVPVVKALAKEISNSL
jgi:DNA (cytosine-5)-methyltransferase 1